MTATSQRPLGQPDFSAEVGRRCADMLGGIVPDILADAMAEGMARFWERRAATMEDARPRPGDFVGKATPSELAERFQRLTSTALQCRRHAQLLRTDGLPPHIHDEIADVLTETRAA